MSDITKVSRALGHEFAAPEFLETALTHRSVGSVNNERLEFLGDAVLSFVISASLYERFPEADEGRLSRLRAALVKGDTLTEIARQLDLGKYLRLGPGEMKSGGHRRASILADALEALIGAVYLDAGIEPARELILRLYGHRFEQGLPEAEQLKDPKTRLQEWLQARGQSLPVYDVSSVSGEAHDQTFVVSCTVTNLPEPSTGVGSSRRKAEQDAASKALKQLTE